MLSFISLYDVFLHYGVMCTVCCIMLPYMTSFLYYSMMHNAGTVPIYGCDSFELFSEGTSSSDQREKYNLPWTGALQLHEDSSECVFQSCLGLKVLGFRVLGFRV